MDLPRLLYLSAEMRDAVGIDISPDLRTPRGVSVNVGQVAQLELVLRGLLARPVSATRALVVVGAVAQSTCRDGGVPRPYPVIMPPRS